MEEIIYASMWKNTSSCWGSYWSLTPVKEDYAREYDTPITAYFVRVQSIGGVKAMYEGPFDSMQGAVEFQKMYQESLGN